MSRAALRPSSSRRRDHEVAGAPPAAIGLRELAGRMLSVPALACWLVAVTVLAAGPLQGLDRALNRPWSRYILPDLRPTLVLVDKFADPTVAMSVVSVVALVVAWRARSIRPLVVTGGAMCTVTALVVTMKLVTARPRPITGNPSFFQTGLENATIYPSGHAANAILIYGIAAYLITRYTHVGQRTARRLWWGVAAISIVAALTSLYLQWHWVTDLLGGFVVGALVLRATVTLDRTYPGGVWTPLTPLLWRLELLTWRLTPAEVRRHGAAPRWEPARVEPARAEPAQGKPARGEPAQGERARGKPENGRAPPPVPHRPVRETARTDRS